MADREQNERFKREVNTILRVDKNFARMFVSTVLLSVVSIALNYLKVRPGFLPAFVSVDFSVLAELIAAIAYGPIIGVLVCLIKSAVLVFITPYSVFSVISNFLINTVFILVTGFYYFRKVFPRRKPRKKEPSEVHRRKTVFVGSLIGMIPAAIVQFYTTLKFVFPKINWYLGKYGYRYEDLLSYYAESTKRIASHLPFYPQPTTLWGNVLLINIPITLLKFLVVALLAMWIYPKISPYLHFRKKGQ